MKTSIKTGLAFLSLALLAGQVHARSSHWKEASCEDLKKFSVQGLTLTPAQEVKLGKCEQHATVSHGKTWTGYGVKFDLNSDGSAYLDSKPCAVDEVTEQATVYSQGLYQIINYKSGKTVLMKNKVFVGNLKH